VEYLDVAGELDPKIDRNSLGKKLNSFCEYGLDNLPYLTSKDSFLGFNDVVLKMNGSSGFRTENGECNNSNREIGNFRESGDYVESVRMVDLNDLETMNDGLLSMQLHKVPELPK
jgi:hypothetical protein